MAEPEKKKKNMMNFSINDKYQFFISLPTITSIEVREKTKQLQKVHPDLLSFPNCCVTLGHKPCSCLAYGKKCSV